ncbi:MAG: glycosyltransferase family 4 protein [Verrucomicrobia bacterium]|nr:glycosyltransferase family 4 protein [Verrucomicrobiota bacterium]
MKPLRCLAISNSYPPDHAGGYELGARNLLDALASHCGWQNSVVASVRKQKPLGVVSPELTGFFPGKLGPEYERWKIRHSLFRNHAKIVAELKRNSEDADFILIFNPRRLILPQWISVLACRKPTFVFVSDYWPQDPFASDLFYSKSRKIEGTSSLKDSKLQEIYKPGLETEDLFADCRGVIFGSRYLREALVSPFSAVKDQFVAHWGIATDQFSQIPFSADRLKTFGFCGRPEKEKGFDLALEAFRQVASQTENVRMLVASDLSSSAFGRSIRKKIQSDPLLNRTVTQLGHIPHKELHTQFYSQIGILLFASIWQEPFALTVLEAMASGVLVIGSSAGGTPEVIDQTTGFLFDPGKEGDLLAVCLHALEEGESNYERVDRGAERIRSIHTLPYMAERVDGFIRDLI